MIVLSAVVSSLLMSLWVVYVGRWLTGKATVDAESSCTLSYMLVFIGTLLIMVNINQVVGSNIIFIVFTIAILFIITKLILTKKGKDQIDTIHDVLSLWGVQLFLLTVVLVLFRLDKFWLVEGPNHDSLIYYEGMKWSLLYPLQASGQMVEALWGLSTCDKGSVFIGRDCLLYRGGTYTLAGWGQFFSLDKTGSGLWAAGVTAGAFAWLSIRVISDAMLISPLKYKKQIFFVTMLASVSTSWLGTLVNSNLATMFASSCVALMFSLIFMPRHKYKPLVMGMLIGLSGHFYGEAIWYTGFFALFALLSDFFNKQENFSRKIRYFLCSSTVVFIVFLITSNYVAYQSLKGLLLLSDIAHGGSAWSSWYIHAPEWYWLGSFVAGDLLGHENISKSSLVYLSVAMLFILLLGMYAKWKGPIIALLGLSGLLVFIIEITAYQYGEHKILQLVGSSWYVFISAGILWFFAGMKKCVGSRDNLLTLMLVNYRYILACAALIVMTSYISIDYFFRSGELLKSMANQHDMNYGNENMASQISAGDIVALDDTALVLGVEPFHKSHYAAFFIHEKGARMVMPDISDDVLRGGYFRDVLNDTLKSASGIDYLLQAKGAIVESSIIKYKHHQVVNYPNYDLINVKNTGVVTIGNGWHRCEPSHCWTESVFNVETHSKTTSVISIEIGYFRPPSNGYVNIYVDGVMADKFATDKALIELKIQKGYHKIRFESSWDIASPQEAGDSNDTRKLFAMIRSMHLNTTLINTH